MILECINKEKIGISCVEISRKINKERTFVFRRLKKLVNQRILECLYGYPKLYKININAKRKLLFKLIECPKCKNMEKVEYEQQTKVCNNCNYRYNIYKIRVKDYIEIAQNYNTLIQHKTTTNEKEIKNKGENVVI